MIFAILEQSYRAFVVQQNTEKAEHHGYLNMVRSRLGNTCPLMYPLSKAKAHFHRFKFSLKKY